MLIGFAGAALAGLILGIYGRAAAIVIMSMLVLCSALPILMLSDWSFGYSCIIVFSILTFMQIGFLAGLCLSTNGARLRKSLPFLSSEAFHSHELHSTKVVE